MLSARDALHLGICIFGISSFPCTTEHNPETLALRALQKMVEHTGRPFFPLPSFSLLVRHSRRSWRRVRNPGNFSKYTQSSPFSLPASCSRVQKEHPPAVARNINLQTRNPIPPAQTNDTFMRSSYSEGNHDPSVRIISSPSRKRRFIPE